MEKSQGGILEWTYRTFMKRNTVYVAFILAGALAGERVSVHELRLASLVGDRTLGKRSSIFLWHWRCCSGGPFGSPTLRAASFQALSKERERSWFSRRRAILRRGRGSLVSFS